jgi:hypothetical protein
MDKCCPALVPYLGARAKADGELVLFMELHPGTTLAKFHRDLQDAHHVRVLKSVFSWGGWDGLVSGSFTCKPGAVPWALKQQLAGAVVGLLVQLEAAGLVHRRLSPSNIILDVIKDAAEPCSYHVQVSNRVPGSTNERCSLCVIGGWGGHHSIASSAKLTVLFPAGTA